MPLTQFLGSDFPRGGRKNICKVRSPCLRAQKPGLFRETRAGQAAEPRKQITDYSSWGGGGGGDKRQPQKSPMWGQQKRTSVLDLRG